MVKGCGNCKFWTKIKSIKGICDKYDYGWANSDSGKDCFGWKRTRKTKPTLNGDITNTRS